MKDVRFVGNSACQTTFIELKKTLYTAPILRGPNWTLPFHISSDAFNTTFGEVLGQQDGQAPYAIYYINKKWPQLNLIILS